MDSIVLAPGAVYFLTIPSTFENNAINGDLDIKNNIAPTDLTIRVRLNGTAKIVQNAAVDDRVLDVLLAKVIIKGVTLSRGGNVTYGGGIRNNGNLTLDLCKVTGNIAHNGGGVANMGGGVLLMRNSVIGGNKANGSGGGLYNQKKVALQLGSKINNNSAGWEGGGVWNGKIAVLNVFSSSISWNKAIGNGGGGVTNKGTLSLANSTVFGNVATHDGGGIGNTGKLTINNSTVSANKGKSGAGIANSNTGIVSILKGSVIGGAKGNIAGIDGGGVMNFGSLTINSSTVSNNTASFGGAFANWGGTVIVSNSTLSGNTATQKGGAIHNKDGGVATIKNMSVISGNKATWDGGGINNWDGTIILAGSKVSSNNSGGGGGGVYSELQLTVTNSSFTGNTATGDGDAVYNNGSNVNATSILGSCIVGNGDIAVHNGQAASQKATGNWWGDASGPSGSGPGTGDSVGANIDFSSWLVAPSAICAP